MTQKLRALEALCHDIDGVVYPHDSVPDLYDAWANANAQAAVDVLGTHVLTLQDAYGLARKGWEQHGDSVTGLTQWVAERGLDPDAFRDAHFHRVHIIARNHFQAAAPHIFARDPEMVAVYAALSPRIRNGAATHGHAEEWAVPLLEGRGILPYFQRDAILGLNHGGYKNKALDPILIEMCLKALGAAPEISGYVEDTLRNLKTAKDRMPSLTNIYLHHGNPHPHQPSYIDYQFRDLVEMKRAILTSQQNDRGIRLT